MRSRDANSTQAVCTKKSSTPARPTSYETATGIDRSPSKAAKASIMWWASSSSANARSASRFAEWFAPLLPLVTGSGKAPAPRPPSPTDRDGGGRLPPLLHHHDYAEEDFDESARECAHADGQPQRHDTHGAE